MYFQSRIDLGSKLGQRMVDVRGSDLIIVSLREQYLQACIGMAVDLRAWIFPFLTEPVTLPGDPRTMGLMNMDGQFTWNPDISELERPEIESEMLTVLEQAKREAFSKVNMAVTQYGAMNKDALQGRTLMLMGDIIKDRIEISAALDYIKTVRYQALFGVGGNVDPLAADDFKLKTNKAEVMDVVANMFEADHYFEQPVGYNDQESRLIAMNIAQYWK